MLQSQRVWKGISNTKARKETARKAKPLLANDLRDLIEGLDHRCASGARDAALLALGWASALRRSELVSLDWYKLGTGGGFVRVDDRGIVVTLTASKASQARPRRSLSPPSICPRRAKPLSAGRLSPS
jgi:integrase